MSDFILECVSLNQYVLISFACVRAIITCRVRRFLEFAIFPLRNNFSCDVSIANLVA